LQSALDFILLLTRLQMQSDGVCTLVTNIHLGYVTAVSNTISYLRYIRTGELWIIMCHM